MTNRLRYRPQGGIGFGVYDVETDTGVSTVVSPGDMPQSAQELLDDARRFPNCWVSRTDPVQP